jgi:hypothetical protein
MVVVTAAVETSATLVEGIAMGAAVVAIMAAAVATSATSAEGIVAAAAAAVEAAAGPRFT